MPKRYAKRHKDSLQNISRKGTPTLSFFTVGCWMKVQNTGKQELQPNDTLHLDNDSFSTL